MNYNYETWKTDIPSQELWRKIFLIIDENNCTCRLKYIVDGDISEWGYIFEPVECCVEDLYWGPIAKWEVEWVEFLTLFEIKLSKTEIDIIDRTVLLCTRLEEEGVNYKIVDGNIRISTVPSQLTLCLSNDRSAQEKAMSNGQTDEK